VSSTTLGRRGLHDKRHPQIGGISKDKRSKEASLNKRHLQNLHLPLPPSTDQGELPAVGRRAVSSSRSVSGEGLSSFRTGEIAHGPRENATLIGWSTKEAWPWLLVVLLGNVTESLEAVLAGLSFPGVPGRV